MSRLEALPADQKSVLQLLLLQGKGYDDLSELLRLDTSEVRSRAYDALDTLGPGAGGLPAARRQEISDWLLGQQEPDEAAATRAFVDGSTAGRVWAHGVARELEPLAGDRLPELPAEGAVTETPAPPPDAPPDEAPAATPFAPAPTAAPRVSRRGGALLIGGVVVAIAVAVVLVIVLSGGDDNKTAASAATTAANTTSTAAQPQVRAQINLVPPKDAPIKKAVAIVQILDVNGQPGITAATQGLRRARRPLTRCGSTTARRRPGSSAASTRPTTRATSSCRDSCPRTSTSPATRTSSSRARRASTNPTRRARSTCAGPSRAQPAARPTAAACRGS